MNLLIITQVVDTQDPILGFFHQWIEEFAKHCEKVTVICLREGEHAFPGNVRVLSLGKEVGASRVKYLSRFYLYIWRQQKQYDAVFVHMNPEYVILGAMIWRLLKKRIALWYTHKSVNSTLRFATRFAHVIFTASKESFRIKSAKVQVVGHGIDTDLFQFQEKTTAQSVRLISVGRISRVKRQDLAIETLAELGERNIDATLSVVGVPLTENDQSYKQELVQLAKRRGVHGHLVWRGPVVNTRLPEELERANILLHTSETGSLDKVVLEAMACGVPVVSSSEAVSAVVTSDLKSYTGIAAQPTALADVIMQVCGNADHFQHIRLSSLRVARGHALRPLIENIVHTTSAIHV